MENIDDQQIENYLRNKMTSGERQLFEDALDANPELRRRTDELRRFSEGIRQIARAGIRRRAESVRDEIKAEEQTLHKPASRPFPWRLVFELVLVAGLLWLGYAYFFKNGTTPPPAPPPQVVDTVQQPVAASQFESLFSGRIPGPGGKTQLSVLLDPAIGAPGAPVYALDSGGGGLCLFVHRDDDFWKKSPELIRKDGRFFLKLSGKTYLLTDDGEEHPLFEQSSGH